MLVASIKHVLYILNMMGEKMEKMILINLW